MKVKAAIGVCLALLLALVPVSSLSSSSETKDVVVLTSSNTIVINSEINGDSVAKAISDAKKLDNAHSGVKERVSGKQTFYLFLNTPGGSVQSGLELMEALGGLNHKVDTITLFAASMGFQIVQGLGDRLILRSGIMMSHHAAGQVSGEFGGSVKTQMENRQQLWLDRTREMDEQTVSRTKGKQTYESYTKEYDHEMWLTGTKSVKEGYSDKIVSVRCDASLDGVTTNHINFLGVDIAYDLDNCPLNTSPTNIRVGNSIAALSTEYTNNVKQQFLTQFILSQKKAIPMY